MRTVIALFACIVMWSQNSFGQLTEDKALHFLGGNLFGLVGAGLADQISNGNRTWTFVGSVGGSLLIGLAKEGIDQKQYGGWDNQDLLATVLGGASIGVTIDIFKQKKKKRQDRIYHEAIDKLTYKEQDNANLNHYCSEKMPTMQLVGFSPGVLQRLLIP